MRRLAPPACLLALAALSARAGELGACGDGRGIQTIVASSSTGAAVGSGIERGVVVYLRGLSKADDRVIDMPYGAGLFAEPGGGRFALLKNASVHLYSFSGFQRISKSSVKVLKDQSTIAWSWIEGTDDVAVFSQIAKSGLFDMGESKKTPYLLRFNIATGAGTQVQLQIPKDFLSATFDAKGERVAVGFWDGHVEVRSAMDGKLVASYSGHDNGSSAIGLAFHPRQNLVASSAGDKVILFDLDTKSIRSTKPSEDGTKLLQYVAEGQFLIGASVFNISLLDPEGRRLQTVHSEDSYQNFYVADPLRKVFSVRENLVCWNTFERWEKAPVVGKN
ncbi:MAG: WD40 repeat domain-containing protein [Thermoanaerobaculia bacterium]